MKAFLDIAMLTIGFWVAAIKLIGALHQSNPDDVIPVPPIEIVEERPDPDVEVATHEKQVQVQQEKAALLEVEKEAKAKKAAEEVVKLKAEKEARVKALENAEKEVAELKRKEVVAKAKAVQEQQEKEAAVKKQEAEREAEEQKRQQDAEELKKRQEAAKPIPPPEREDNDKSALHWIRDLNEGKRLAKELNRNIFIAFEGEGCILCRELAENVYSHPHVSPVLRKEMIPVWLYVTDENDNHRSEFQEGNPHFPLAVVWRPNGSWSAWRPKFNRNIPLHVNVDNFLKELQDRNFKI